MPMRASMTAFWLQKAGSAPAEYEDAYCAPLKDNCAADWRVAVADGATESSFSGIWASMLVHAFCAGTRVHDFTAALPNLRSQWKREVAAQPLPWYAEEKARRGAFSSLIGLAIRNSGIGSVRWHALAVGDSCLFQIRNGGLLHAFPMAHSEAFNNRPYLISSNAAAGENSCSAIVQRSGLCAPGDTFYLMTDALACWFLRRQEEDGTAVACLSDVRSQEVFESLVQELRGERDEDGLPSLKNDDVTLVRLDLLNLSEEA